ncbi:MAG: chemotaxis protein CheW [Methanosarcinaceae archaeon]|nr:chemotaxis protein CheW [Methanosarcinaceae archaeon]
MSEDVSIHDVESADDLLQLVIFQLGGEEFGVEIMQVQEIIRMPDITRIPQSPEYVEGVINLRGKIIVVINLNTKFDLHSKELDADSRIIIVEIGENVVGMIVDSVSEVLRLSTSSVEPAPDIISTKIKADYLKGVGKLDKRLLILLDLERVLNDDEMAQLESVSEMHG